jgi:hypothetical protein
MYSLLDVRTLDFPVTSPEAAGVDSQKFYQIQDRYFLAYGAESIRAKTPNDDLVALLIDSGLIDDTGVVSIFESDSDGVPFGWGKDGAASADDPVAGIDAHDHDAALTNLLEYLNK